MQIAMFLTVIMCIFSLSLYLLLFSSTFKKFCKRGMLGFQMLTKVDGIIGRIFFLLLPSLNFFVTLSSQNWMRKTHGEGGGKHNCHYCKCAVDKRDISGDKQKQYSNCLVKFFVTLLLLFSYYSLFVAFSLT